jgi:hypothetical protein
MKNKQGELFASLPPMSHPTIPGVMRVPLHELDGVYELHVAERFLLRYTDENLPEKVKVALAFIKAGKLPIKDPPTHALYGYINSMGEDYDSIGWRSHQQIPHGHMYIIILPRKYIFSLAGEPIKKEL